MIHQCPNCNTVGKVPASKAGRKARCRKCGHVSPLPPRSPAGRAARILERHQGEHLSFEQRAGAVALILLLVLAFIGYVSMPGPSQEDVRRDHEANVKAEAKRRLEAEREEFGKAVREAEVQWEMGRQRGR
jgi:predicted Zn finger-like uncharacterized protein